MSQCKGEHMFKRRLSFGAVVAVGLGMLALPAHAQKTPLTLYTALENDQLKPFKDAIEAAVPEVDIQWVRDSTGVITARFLAEKAAPKADVVLGLAASSVLLFNKEGLLDKYQPSGADKLKANFKSADGLYTGMDAFLGVVCYNTVEGGKAGATVPKAYSDLLDPKFKGKIVMPHPASSGTGYLMVAAWLQNMGNDAGWKFMDGLHENIAVYTHSGSAPCVQAAKGERVIGLGFDMRAAREKSNGAPIEIVLPTEGVGWEMEASAIVKGTSHLAQAKKVMDWVASKSANELYSKYYALVAHPEVNNLPPNYPVDAEAKMAKVDLQKMANDREAILAEWIKRYDGKAAPK
jgi:iron(III) transport system substrate-binding protein